MRPIARIVSPFDEKFGTPRQSGLVDTLSEIHFEEEFRTSDALRGLEGFDYIWLIWDFSLNKDNDFHPTVRPPRLGGNERMGVFATRSPYRPNPVGLSSVRIDHIDFEKCVIYVLGADLVNGTPIYDIKPYIAYTDSHPEARSGFTDTREWERLTVTNPEGLGEELLTVLSLDPRPQYHNDPEKVYGLTFRGHNIRFKVNGEELTVLATDISQAKNKEERKEVISRL